MTADGTTPQLYLLRLAGEIATKGRGTRLHFLRRLHGNLESALAATGMPYRIEREWSRFFVEAGRWFSSETPNHLPSAPSSSSLWRN